MEKTAIEIKGFVAAVFAFLTTLWGWFGWLVVGWIALMALDYFTGSRVAIKKSEWNSKAAREGIAHKGIMIVVVAGTGVFDFVIGSVVNSTGSIKLPFEYTVLLCPLVIVWYVITEMGSLIENAEKSGANVPPFLSKIVKGMKVRVTDAGNKLAEPDADEKRE